MGSRIVNGKEIKEHDGEVLIGKKTTDSDLSLKRIQEIHSGNITLEKIEESKKYIREVLSGKKIIETAENQEISADGESKFLRIPR